jgi:hypothetical protein
MKLSPKQTSTLLMLASNSEPIAYFKGGFWTLPSIGNNPNLPWRAKWYTQPNVLQSLLGKGFLSRTAGSTNYDIDLYPSLSDYILTESGLSKARELVAQKS